MGYTLGKSFLRQRWWSKKIEPYSVRSRAGSQAKQPLQPSVSAPIPSILEETTRRRSWLRTSSWALFLDLVTPLLMAVYYVFHEAKGRLRRLGFAISPLNGVEMGGDPKEKLGYVALLDKQAYLWRTRFYGSVEDAWARPIKSVPGSTIKVAPRHKPLPFTKYKEPVQPDDQPSINMASYNYLGFAQNEGVIPSAVADSIRQHGLTFGSPALELGTSEVHRNLEKDVAQFVGKEDAILCPMGFATNSMHLPALADEGTLIISDEQNHASLILGCRLSGATIKVFKHNDTRQLEKLLRHAVMYGNERGKCKWRKILIVVEGAYSMEGTIVNLPEVVRLKKKYKTYLYVDEAHSIGALGSRGRGVADYFNVDTKDIDILMGTFTKSFAAFGGYIAASKDIIEHLRVRSHGQTYAHTMSPPVVQQIKLTMSCIQGKDGTHEGKQKLQQLHKNTVYVREKLASHGFEVYGHADCPIVPVRFPYMAITMATRILQQLGVSIVIVGYPAVPVFQPRIRLCVSADHTKEQLDRVIDFFDQLGYVGGAQRYKKGGFLDYCRKNELRRIRGNYIDIGDYAYGKIRTA